MNKAQDTELPSTKIAVMNTNIAYIQKDISEIKGSIKELAGVYVTREALIEVSKQTEERFKVLEEAIFEIKKSGNLWRWLSPTLAAIVSSIGTFLIINYLQHLK